MDELDVVLRDIRLAYLAQDDRAARRYLEQAIDAACHDANQRCAALAARLNRLGERCKGRRT